MSLREGRDLESWLHEVRSEYWARLAALDAGLEESGRPHVLFRVARRTYAVDAGLCRGVVRRTRVAKLPGVPDHLLGVTGVRGEVISATDPASLLGVGRSEVEGRRADAGYFLILSSQPLTAAMWVDWVEDVVLLDPEAMLQVEERWGGAAEGLLVGQWQGREPPVCVIDGRRYLELSAVRAMHGGERSPG